MGVNKMKNILRHENFIGTVHFSAEDECFFGKIEGIDDLITFEGQDVRELKKAFKEALADYKELCIKVGKPAHKSYTGTFNIRIGSELHKKAAQKSIVQGISLNQFIQKAVEKAVK